MPKLTQDTIALLDDLEPGDKIKIKKDIGTEIVCYFRRFGRACIYVFYSNNEHCVSLDTIKSIKFLPE